MIPSPQCARRWPAACSTPDRLPCIGNGAARGLSQPTFASRKGLLDRQVAFKPTEDAGLDSGLVASAEFSFAPEFNLLQNDLRGTGQVRHRNAEGVTEDPQDFVARDCLAALVLTDRLSAHSVVDLGLEITE